MDQINISVIICGYTLERLDDIHKAVETTLNQTLRPHEVIVAVDHNEELFHKLAVELTPRARAVLGKGIPGLSDTRNTGIHASTGEVVAFIDDDAVAEPTWLENLANHYQDPQVIAVGGKAIPQWLNGNRPGWFPEELDWIVGCTHKGLSTNKDEIRNMIGCNMSFRRDIFDRAGFFRSEVGRVGKLRGVGEEAEICLRIKAHVPEAQIVYEPNAIIYHKVPSWRHSLKYFVQRSYDEGFYKDIVKKLSSDSSPDALTTEGTYLRHLLFSAIPQRLVRFYEPWTLAQIGALELCIAAVGAGYMRGKFRRHIT
ncbi:MAG: glycosyltransferase family 2 protein [Planctomycetes bacterium]|nr:glycosyltransferase family 2 protein [Planctomycetota bacterium]